MDVYSEDPIRTLLSLMKVHIILISSLNPGGYIWGGCIATPNGVDVYSEAVHYAKL